MALRIFWLFFILYSIKEAKAVTISGFAFNKSTYQRFEKAEATFTLSASYSNPYDSAIVAVDAEITPPSGPMIEVPCFYFVPCTFSGSNATEHPSGARWMLRYTPTLTGTYQVRIRVRDGSTSYSSYVSFNVVPSSRKGFIRIDATNNQFLRFDNGTPYYPVGYNLCWNDYWNLITFYKNFFDNLSPNKVNWIRYWLTDFARQAIEWRSSHWSGWYSGIGRYSQRSCAILDSVLNLCAHHDVYMQLVLQHHGQVSTSVDPQWSENPYNSANGGPISNAGDFFTHPAVRSSIKKMYRYIVARWGYSTNIMSWELFNEVEYTDGTDPNIDAWHDEMSKYLKYVDPNDHIVNTSTGQDNSTFPLLDNNVALDQIQWHTYAGSIEKVLYNQSRTFLTYNKPVMCGEFGTGTAYPNGGGHPDHWGDHVRKSMWIGMMSDVPNMFWYWDEYIMDKNLYHIFKPLGDYLAGEDIVLHTGGNGKKIKFLNNPSMVGTVQVSPTQTSWAGTNTPNPFTSTIDANGNASNVNGLHNYIHGSWQGTRNRELIFTVTFQAAGNVELNVTSVSGSGTKQIQVYVDGSHVTTWNPSGAGTFTYTGIPAGTRVIRLYSTGQDWIEFSNIRFTNVQLRACDAWGYTGSLKAYGYVNNVSYGDWADPSTIPNITTASLRVGPLTPGSYNVQYWDPVTGTVTSGGTVTTSLDSVTLNLPSFKKDIAYKITSTTLPVDIIDLKGQLTPDGKVMLTYTALQSGSATYTIMRSFSQSDYMPIHQKEHRSPFTSVISHTIYDQPLEKGLYYYKLISTDDAGIEKHSKTITVAIPEYNISIYPNPVHECLHIQHSEDSSTTLRYEILTVDAKIVDKGIYFGQGIAVNHLPPGQYFISIYNHGDSKATVFAFVKR
ncbi:MAG: DUF5060 domain-containing protein [Cytophagaceae bacterium]|nr:DUF5060 domain-containing protein [Cytophagaceae bacterium]MDW8455730.1 DUF5060 domain-containing protein [Cytophagaceae bacterium]